MTRVLLLVGGNHCSRGPYLGFVCAFTMGPMVLIITSVSEEESGSEAASQELDVDVT